MSHSSSWLLVNVPTPNEKMFPLGLAYISAVLKQAGYRVSCLDLGLTSPAEDAIRLSAALDAAAAGVIGISGLSRDFSRMRAVLEEAKRHSPQIVTVVGGGGVSSDPEFFAAALKADFGVLGEGEETVIELARVIAGAGSPDNVAGLVFRGEDGGYRRTAERRGTKDLDALPLPDYDGFYLERYFEIQKHAKGWIFSSWGADIRFLPVVFSRSCPFPCTFCFHSIAKYRERSIDAIFAEIEFLVEKYKVNMLNIYDDLFAVKPQRIREFCERIKKTGLMWGCQLRVNVIDDDLLAMMRDAGCRTISFGFESISESVLTSMKKKVNAGQIMAAAEATYRGAVDIQANFIFGDFAEDYQSINETMTWWMKHDHYGVNLSPLDVYPGAQIYHRAIAEGIIGDPMAFLEQGCPWVNLTRIPEAEVKFLFGAFSVSHHRIPATILQAEVVPWEGEQRLSVTVVCPHCGEEVHYGNLPLSDCRTFCRICNGRWDVPFTRLAGRNVDDQGVTQWLAEGISALKRNDIGTAARMAEKAINLHPQDIDAHHLLGVALLASGQSAVAVHILRGAVGLNPDIAALHVNLSAAYLAEGWSGLAYLSARQALVLQPGLPQAAHNLRLAGELAADGEIFRFIPAGPKLPVSQLQLMAPELTAGAAVPQVKPLRQRLPA